MEKINAFKNFDELKSIFYNPRLYLADYFIDLRSQVDLFFCLKRNMANDWLEIIERINSFEKETYNSVSLIQIFLSNMQLIEIKLKSIDSDHIKIIQQIKELKQNIEKILFSNKTIAFIKDFKNETKNFLIIINDEYLSNNALFYSYTTETIILNNEQLKSLYLMQQLWKCKRNVNEFNLNVKNLKELYLMYKEYFQNYLD
jgi:hypothetical protein